VHHAAALVEGIADDQRRADRIMKKVHSSTRKI